jgi:signal peptidase I
MTKAKAAAKTIDSGDSAEGFLKETIKTVLYAVVLATLFRSFFYEPFNIPSESMLPTLMTGDYIFVSKMRYGYSRFSFPFGPNLFSGRILKGEVERGDIAVFKLPRDNESDYIKRIIGLPGDRIQMLGGILYLNGQAVPKAAAGAFVFTEQGNMNCLRWPQYRFPQPDGAAECRYPQYQETLPNGVSYMTLDVEPVGPADTTRVYIVPEGHYFAMGDNRDNSSDSRVPSAIGVGFIPEENLIGRANIIFFSTNGEAALWQVWKWFSAMRYGRFFTLLTP